MSASGFEDATQEPYPSDSETASQLDGVFDIGTQCQSPRPYPELDIDLGSQLRELDQDSEGPSPSGRSVAGPEISSPAAGVGGSTKAPTAISSKQNPAPSPGVLGAKNPSDEVAQRPKANPGRGVNPMPIGFFKQAGLIESNDSDDDVIFVSCRPRTTPESWPVRVKEEPKDQGNRRSSLSAVLATAEPTGESRNGSTEPARRGPGSEFGDGESARSCTVEGDGTQGTPPAQLSIPHPAKEIGRPRFVPKADVVKRIQANLLRKNMERTALGAQNRTSTVPTGRSPSGEEPSNSQTGPRKSPPRSSDVPKTSTEIIIVDDDLENEWMNQDIEEDDESDA